MRIRISEVVQDGIEQKESTDGEEARSDYWHDPLCACEFLEVRLREERRSYMSGLSTCPAKPEQTDRNTEGTDERRRQALLGLNVAILVELRLLHVVEIQAIKWDNDESTAENTQEGKPFFSEVEMVDPFEHDGERFEPNVEKAVDQSDVEVEEEEDGLVEVQGQRPDQYHLEHREVSGV